MGNVFAGSEIVEMGIQIENNGRDFYNILAGRSKDKKAADLFKYLAAEEEGHIAVFKKILGALHRYEPQEAYPGEYFEYMNALASDYVFTKKDAAKDVAGRIKSEKEALDMGIGFEKDSIIFYGGMKKAVPTEELKAVDQLISQENSHLKKLIDMKKTL